MKSVLENLEEGFRVFYFLPYYTCLRVEGGHFQQLLQHAVNYVQVLAYGCIMCENIELLKLPYLCLVFR
jgi:hypothetical protein